MSVYGFILDLQTNSVSKSSEYALALSEVLKNTLPGTRGHGST